MIGFLLTEDFVCQRIMKTDNSIHGFKHWLKEKYEPNKTKRPYNKYKYAAFYLVSNGLGYYPIIPGLNEELQGKDLIFYNCLKRMGCKLKRFANLNHAFELKEVYECCDNDTIYDDYKYEQKISGLGYVDCRRGVSKHLVGTAVIQTEMRYGGGFDAANLYTAMIVTLPGIELECPSDSDTSSSS